MVCMWLKKGGYVVLCIDCTLEGAMRKKEFGVRGQEVCSAKLVTFRCSVE